MRAVLGFVLLALVAGAAAPAAAQTDQHTDDTRVSDRPASEELERLKEATLLEIDRRLGALAELAGAVAASDQVTDGHRAVLSNRIEATRGRLEDLRRQVASVGTLRELRVQVSRIVQDFWVFGLVVPQVREVLAADAIVAAANDMESVHDQIAGVVERAAAAGIDVEAATRELHRSTVTLAEAAAVARAVPPSVLGVTADHMPQAGEELVAGAEQLARAFALLRESADAMRRAVGELRSALPHSDT